MDLEGLRALVTGGSDGIGLELARGLKRRGVDVTVAGRRTERLLDAEAEGLRPVQADLSTAPGCEHLLSAVRGGQIDMLINNAGADPSFKVGQPVDLPEVDRAIFLNLNAPIHLTCGLLEGMRARNQGTIVNVTSGLAIAPSADTPVYCATKAGLRSFTMALRAQLANSNIVVIEALPPMVDTAMTSATANPAKITATSCADAIIQGIVDGKTVINIGQVKVLSRIYSVSPALARRIMLRS